MRPPWTWSRWPIEPLAPASEDSASARPCFVHLVRKANGIGMLREFAEAHRGHAPGVDHELVFLMKGFASPRDARPYLAEVEDLKANVQYFPDRRFDLGVYFAAAARLRRDRYCFMNSNGRPQVDGWLAMLDAALARPDVGQVGATGSWGSQHSWLRYSMGLPSAYRGLMPPAPLARKLLTDIELERYGKDRRSIVDSVRGRLRTIVRIPEELLGFEPFPTHHLRPASFMISHARMMELRMFVVRNKMDTYAIESGRDSITRQLQRLGLTSLVVDRSGSVYTPDNWYLSRTFCQGEQEGLLVADNQSAYYANGDLARRRLLATFAWGPAADPVAPASSGAEASGDGQGVTFDKEDRSVTRSG
jgi:hypothetical protein